jgi:vacuolar-type H+-ATPase subunit I/STV1
MAIAKMNKVYLIAHQAEKEQVLSILQQSGMVEISDLQTKDAGRELWAELVESDQDQDALQELEDDWLMCVLPWTFLTATTRQKRA